MTSHDELFLAALRAEIRRMLREVYPLLEDEDPVTRVEAHEVYVELLRDLRELGDGPVLMDGAQPDL